MTWFNKLEKLLSSDSVTFKDIEGLVQNAPSSSMLESGISLAMINEAIKLAKNNMPEKAFKIAELAWQSIICVESLDSISNLSPGRIASLKARTIYAQILSLYQLKNVSALEEALVLLHDLVFFETPSSDELDEKISIIQKAMNAEKKEDFASPITSDIRKLRHLKELLAIYLRIHQDIGYENLVNISSEARNFFPPLSRVENLRRKLP